MSEPTETTEHTGTVPELRDELREREVPISGTKDELIERLEAADAADAEAAGDADEDDEDDAADDDEAAEDDEDEDEDEAEKASPAVAAGLIDADGAVDTAKVADFGARSQALVADIRDTLERDLVAVLVDYEANHTDPAAGPSMAASRAVRAHMDDARGTCRHWRRPARTWQPQQPPDPR
jgi:hypothetical protein